MNIAARIEIVDLDSGKIIQDGKIFEPVRVEDRHPIYDEYEFHVKFTMVKEERNTILQNRLEDYPWEMQYELSKETENWNGCYPDPNLGHGKNWEKEESDDRMQ